MMEFQMTCWRGMEIRHPAGWELAVASGPEEEPGLGRKCTFADREFQRLEVRWRELASEPKIEILMEKHRKAAQDLKVAGRDMTGLPDGWQGFYQEAYQEACQKQAEGSGQGKGKDRGVVVRTARGFDIGEGTEGMGSRGKAKGEKGEKGEEGKKGRMLVEATMVWPTGRDVELERRILMGMRPEGRKGTRLWRAMGMEVELGREYDMVEMKAPVGKIEWVFSRVARTAPPAQAGEGGREDGEKRDRGKKGEKDATVSLSRLAMPKYWLDGPLRDWVAGQAPALADKLRQEPCEVNGHRGEMVLSEQELNAWANWRGWKQYRLDVAWLCPVEERVYHIVCRQRRRDAELSLPESLRVGCCGAGWPGKGCGADAPAGAREGSPV
ncbi:MAG: hypothetical protein NTV86_13815 [Planctomycetota bacterium]|nr:hypothetical protein [Planctomycetota bacterium]